MEVGIRYSDKLSTEHPGRGHFYALPYNEQMLSTKTLLHLKEETLTQCRRTEPAYSTPSLTLSRG